jgi:Tetracyclin repressor-like, C-terminal domain
MLLDRLRSATERDMLRPDIDHAVLVDQVSGPIYYRVLITGAPADRDYAERLVRAVLAGAIGPAVEAAPQRPR